MEYQVDFKAEGRYFSYYNYYYRDNKLLFTFKYQYIYFSPFLCNCIFYDSAGNKIFTFRYISFLIGMKLKLLTQSLPHPITIERKNIRSYSMKVMGKEISLKSTYLPYFVRKYGTFYVDGKSYGSAVRKKRSIGDLIMGSSTYVFDFKEEEEEDSELNYYCMLLFTMHAYVLW